LTANRSGLALKRAGTDAGTVICGLIRGMCVTPRWQAGTARCRDS